MIRAKQLLIATTAIILVVSLMSVTTRERGYVTLIEEKLIQALAPLERGLGVIAEWIRARIESVLELGRLRVENALLRDENEHLRALLIEYQEMKAENQRLRELVNFAPTRPESAIAAQVIGRNPDNWFGYVEVNKGSSHGVAPNMAVVSPAGLVGRVTKVTDSTATIMLLLDPESGVGGLVQRSRDTGIVLGGVTARGTLTMNLFSREADVRYGDVIVSSGLGRLFPPGLIIGEVVSVDRNRYSLYVIAEVKPAVNFGRLAEVLILSTAAELLPRSTGSGGTTP
ncbi:MAG: rod shape-determining protein MreC [Bacillota bacterium]